MALAEAAKLYEQVQAYTDESHISETSGDGQVEMAKIDILCQVADESTTVEVLVEKYDFEIHIGNLLTLNKVEGQEVFAEDVSPFIRELLDAIKQERASVVEHKLLGKVAYSLAIKPSISGDNNNLIAYESLVNALIKKFGSKHTKGVLRFKRNKSRRRTSE